MKKCAICKEKYTPTRGIQPTCNRFECLCAYADKAADKSKARRSKAERVAVQQDRKIIREKKESLKTMGEYIKEAQVAFNAFIRYRDMLAGHPCISSGKPLDWSGNNVDAGHYRSRGSAPHLRFDERNCHAQSKHDNRYLQGNVANYRIGLIERIGLEEVEKLESENKAHKWSVEEFKAIKSLYVAKLKELKRGAD